MEFTVREFRPEDLESVIMINKVCLPENYSPDFFMEHHWENPRIFLVAQVGEKVVGYNMCRIEFGISNIKRDFAKKGHVISIAVLEGYRGMGIGQKLMEEGMKNVRGAGASEIYLEVRQSNLPAIQLYRKLGFRAVRVLEGYYRDGENAYLMVANLEEKTSFENGS
ncbi:MAG: ribosomal protein S18-alanine N-acetyltransferase [Candidatus Methanosuratincola sp.]|jgi:ribosomal-protein-alanine N-acetyltransferase|nr:ribosomal protein S18-alanine N-acetyltransferase [Candidatus Methanosuratincola sp.]